MSSTTSGTEGAEPDQPESPESLRTPRIDLSTPPSWVDMDLATDADHGDDE